MFFLIFLAIVVLAMIGVGSVLGSIGALILLPILFLKVMLFMMLFGFIGRRFRGRGRSWDWAESSWRGRPRPGRQEPTKSREDRFEEWHRMAHAREEVDGWVSDLDDIEPE